MWYYRGVSRASYKLVPRAGRPPFAVKTNEDIFDKWKVIHSTSGRPRALIVDFKSFVKGEVLQTTEEPSRASTS